MRASDDHFEFTLYSLSKRLKANLDASLQMFAQLQRSAEAAAVKSDQKQEAYASSLSVLRSEVDGLRFLKVTAEKLCATAQRELDESNATADEIEEYLRDPNRFLDMHRGAKFCKRLLDAGAPFVALENPAMHRYATAAIGGLRSTATNTTAYFVLLTVHDLLSLLANDCLPPSYCYYCCHRCHYHYRQPGVSPQDACGLCEYRWFGRG